MLNLILGRAGSGKTTELYSRIRQVAQRGEKAVLLVPDQYSFESERELYRQLGPRLSSKVEVVGFVRLCNNIFRSLGGLAGDAIDDTGRTLLMSMALDEVVDKLRLYGSQKGNVAFVGTMIETIRELKSAGVTPEGLEEFSNRQENGLLRDKTWDLSLLLGAYQALLETGYSDPDDDLARAERLLREADYFGGMHVFIDAYVAFMEAEYRLIAHMLRQAEGLTVALSCTSLSDPDEGLGVFSAASETASHLVRLAREQGVGVASPHKLEEPLRFESEQLRAIEQQFLQTRGQCPADSSDVLLFCAQTPYEELETVAAQIRYLVREKGLRYADIAVICRRLEGYETPVERVFEKFDIPCFMDRPRSAVSTPLVRLLLAALEAVSRGYPAEAVLRYAKNPALGFSPDALGKLENYCFIWGVDRRRWFVAFENHPDGLSDHFSEEDTRELESINRMRARVTEPLRKLEEALRNPTGRSFAEGLYTFLYESHAAQNLSTLAEELPAEERALFLDEQSGVWDAIMAIFSTFSQVIGERGMPLERLTELLTMAFETVELGEIPQTLDQVIVGMADRVRPNAPKAVFVIGAVEGEFPLLYSASGVFTDREREDLTQGGIALFRSAKTQFAQERYYAYFALTQASRFLGISYPRASLKGELRSPSLVISAPAEILDLPIRESWELPKELFVVGQDTAVDALAKVWHRDEPVRATLLTLLDELGDGANTQQRAFAARVGGGTSPDLLRTGPEVGVRLFGEKMKLSPSRVERYYNCPFSYFCYGGLGLRPRRKVEFNPMESGNVIHLVLEQMVARYGARGLHAVSEHALRQEIRAIIDDYLADKLPNRDALPKRFHYLYTRLVSQLVRLVQQLAAEFAQSRFEPKEFELKIDPDSKVQPLELVTPDGMSVLIEGTVDRVDVMESEDKKYVRVVDYKSGTKTFSLSDVYYGLNMQMLIYLFSIWENGREDLRGALPAGVLYMPARSRFVSAERTTPEEEVRRQQMRTFRMSGLVLEDDEVIEGMESGRRGVFIPVKYKNDGTLDATSSVGTLEQMGALKRKIEENISEMARHLAGGEIPALPADGSGYGPCTWCDFRAICGREENDPVRSIDKISHSKLFEKLEENLDEENTET